MRRGMLLALLALGLPTAALATSVDYSTGNFVSGSISGSFTTMEDLSITGVDHTIAVDTGTLTAFTGSTCPPGATCFSFTGGTITVDGTVFTDALKGGILTDDHGSIAILATLAPVAGMVKEGSVTIDGIVSGTTVGSGSGNVSFSNTTVPEPSTLGLLGTGLIGLAGMVRRKLKLPT